MNYSAVSVPWFCVFFFGKLFQLCSVAKQSALKSLKTTTTILYLTSLQVYWVQLSGSSAPFDVSRGWTAGGAIGLQHSRWLTYMTGSWCQMWARSSAGTVGWCTNMWPPYVAWAYHREAAGLWEGASLQGGSASCHSAQRLDLKAAPEIQVWSK